MKILDCTIRDGGYYTDWDFDSSTVETYLRETKELPIDFLEIGYRSPTLKGYQGEYFYLPESRILKIKKASNKHLVIILNEKDIHSQNIEEILKPCLGNIYMVRLAIDPTNFPRALRSANKIKKLGFVVALNVMYLSKWEQDPNFFEELKNLEEVADFLYMVDSFGGIYPSDLIRIIKKIREKTSILLGFHGHNNLELALANSIFAIEAGVEIIDCTFTGMGRGAGNLKTELLLTYLEKERGLNVNFDALDIITSTFEKLQKKFNWGTNLAYMVAGANSIPQKEVMDWVNKRFFSYNSIIRAIDNKRSGVVDNVNNIEILKPMTNSTLLLVGGGHSVKENIDGLLTFLEKNPHISIVHVSSRNAGYFKQLVNLQLFCLSGNEGVRLEKIYAKSLFVNSLGVLPPYPRKMGTYIPKKLKEQCKELNEMDPFKEYPESMTAIALKIALDTNKKDHFIVGFDGYSNSNISQKESDLFLENNVLFKKVGEKLDLQSLTKTKYESLIKDSLYKYIA